MTGGDRPTEGIRVGVLFSHGTRIVDWIDAGLFDREVAHLRRLHEAVGEVHLVTYDEPSERTQSFRAEVAPLILHTKRARVGYRVYAFLAPLLERRTFLSFDVLRTTQLGGAWMGSMAKILWGTPLVVRCGFVRSRNYQRSGARKWRIYLARILETLVIRSADRVLVATESDLEYLMRTSGCARSCFVVLPNPIDTELFTPALRHDSWGGRVLYVGRLNAEKNVAALIDAVQSSEGLRLTIVGDGPLRSELERRARRDQVTFAGVIPNNTVAEMLQSCDVFVLPSHFEGNPKSLIEAMASGCAVVGARSPGIETLIVDGVNGVLSGTDADSISHAIKRFERSAELRDTCREGARSFAVEHFDATQITMREAAVMREVVRQATGHVTGRSA